MIRVIFIVAMVVIASAWGLFFLADRQGMFTARARVMGNVEGSNATQCYLYIDGVKSANQHLDYVPPPSYYNYQGYDFEFYVDVAANVEHEFRVTTSDGEGSNTELVYTPFGRETNVYLSIFGETTQMTVRGSYIGNNSNPSVNFYIDDELVRTVRGDEPDHLEYDFTRTVYRNQYYVLKVTAFSRNEGTLSNQTVVYVGSDPVTVSIDLIGYIGRVSERKIDVNILGNYTGVSGYYRIYCSVNNVTTDEEYSIEPDHTEYSFTVSVLANHTYCFRLDIYYLPAPYILYNQSTVFVGGEPLTLYIDMDAPAALANIKGNYTGDQARCTVYLYVNGVFSSSVDIINPGHVAYSFLVDVYSEGNYTFTLVARDHDLKELSSTQASAYIGNYPITLYMDVG